MTVDEYHDAFRNVKCSAEFRQKMCAKLSAPLTTADYDWLDHFGDAADFTAPFDLSEPAKTHRHISWKIPVICAAAVLLLGGGVLYVGAMLHSPMPDISPDLQNSYISNESSETSVNAVENQPSAEDNVNAEALGGGLYRLAKLPQLNRENDSCIYGSVRMGNETVEVDGQTLDLSVAVQDDGANTAYCVSADSGTLYYANMNGIYQSDIGLQHPQQLLSLPISTKDGELYVIYSLISFANTDQLFFTGSIGNARCIGSFDTKTCSFRTVPCAQKGNLISCDTGVLVYDNAAASNQCEKTTVQYWESGEIYEITLRNVYESETKLRLSANGKYLCTYLWGKTENGQLTERYSVYDVKSGTFLGCFDWTFDKKVTDRISDGFTYLGMDEDAKCAYFTQISSDKWEYYQFCFGE